MIELIFSFVLFVVALGPPPTGFSSCSGAHPIPLIAGGLRGLTEYNLVAAAAEFEVLLLVVVLLLLLLPPPPLPI